MGHFMVVLKAPQRITANSCEAADLGAVWPEGAQQIWMVSTMESTRAEEGLYMTNMLVGLNEKTGALFFVGELDRNGDLAIMEDRDTFEIWQSPAQLRAGLRPDLMRAVVSEMEQQSGSWSMTTAARALFRGAKCDPSADKEQLMAEMKGCWSVDPICTSIVIIFWQRYMCKLVDYKANLGSIKPLHPCDLLMEFMPLMADRGLPGELVQAMLEHGWTKVSTIASAAPPLPGPCFASALTTPRPTAPLRAASPCLRDPSFDSSPPPSYRAPRGASDCDEGDSASHMRQFETVEPESPLLVHGSSDHCNAPGLVMLAALSLHSHGVASIP